MKKTLVEHISHISPCQEAISWLESLPASTTPQKAWDACENGSWMIWLIGKTIKSEPWSDDRKPFLACALDCALTVKHLWRKISAKKIGDAVAVMRKWIKGVATKEDVSEARRDIYADAYTTAATYAVYTATYAACAADAASADAACFEAVFASASRLASQKQMAAIVRKHYPKPPKL